MSSRRQYSSGGCSYDIPSPRRGLLRTYNHAAPSDNHNANGQQTTAILTSAPSASYNIHFSTQVTNHFCVDESSTTYQHQRICQVRSQLSVHLRTITWLPRKKETYQQRSVLHIFIPITQKTPILRQESWTQLIGIRNCGSSNPVEWTYTIYKRSHDIRK